MAGYVLNDKKEPEPAPEAKYSLVIDWDPAKQDVTLQWDRTQLRTYEFILGLLEMAKRKVEDVRSLQRVRQMQQGMAEAQQMDQIKRQITK